MRQCKYREHINAQIYRRDVASEIAAPVLRVSNYGLHKIYGGLREIFTAW